jgi:hypothetical protein
MTGEEMLSEVLSALQKYLNIIDDDFDNMLMVDEDLIAAIPQLRANALPIVFDDFLKYLLEIVNEDRNGFLSNNYPGIGTLHIVDFTQSALEKKNRGFAYSDPQFAFFSAKALFDNGNLIDFSASENGLLWKQMELFFERDFNPRQDLINIFFDCLVNKDTTKGFLIKQIPDPFEAERHYAYIYLSFLNSSHSVKLPGILNYTSTSLNPALTFATNTEFEQYFDIYDVLNELNQAPDLLTRFLKLYHVLEYYMYRVYLVDLVRRVGSNKFFVREFMTSAERMKKGERETFIANYEKIFDTDRSTINAAIRPTINPTITRFLEEKGLVKAFNPNITKKNAELIYGLRCSIVHNKESEYHLTVSFYDDFIQIIPLLKEIMTIMENLIIEKIKTNHTTIKYSQREVTLF